MSVTMLVSALAGPKLSTLLAPKRVVQIGVAALVVAALGLLATIDVELDRGAFALALAVFGVGAGLLVSQLGDVSCRRSSRTNEAGGLQGTAQNLGASLGTALLGAVLLSDLTGGLVSRVEKDALLAVAVLAFLSFALTRNLPGRTRDQAADISGAASAPSG